MKIINFTLLFSVLLPTLTDATNYHWSNETVSNYVPYPPELQARLDNEQFLYKANGYPLPTLRVFQTFPEKQPRVWLLMKSITARLHPTLWPHVHYELREGAEFGCRTPIEDGQTNDKTGEALNWKPVTTSHCHRHCLHQGRYCLETSDSFDDHHGRAALKEVARRLCIDNVYHAKDPRFVDYIEEYDKNDCLMAKAPRNCSHTAMLQVGLHPQDISKCVAEKDQDSDIPNPILERNMRHVAARREKFASRVQNANSVLPVVSINGDTFLHDFEGNSDPWEKLTTAAIFHKYCNAFPSNVEKPVACQICHDGCDNVRDCLWSLKCNGKTLDVARDITPAVLNMHPYHVGQNHGSSIGGGPEGTPISGMLHHTATDSNTNNNGEPAPAPTKPNLMDEFKDEKPRPTQAPTPRPTKNNANRPTSMMDDFHYPSPTNKPTEKPYHGGKFNTMETFEGMGGSSSSNNNNEKDEKDLVREEGRDSIMGQLNQKPLRKEPRPEHDADDASNDNTDSYSFDASDMMGMIDSSYGEGDDDMAPNGSKKSEESTPGHVLVFWGLIFTMGPMLCGLAFAYYYSRFRSERKQKLLVDIREGKYSLNGSVMQVCRDNFMANGQQGQQPRSPSPTVNSTGSADDGLDGRAPEEDGENHEAVVTRAEQLLKASSAKDLGLSRSSLTPPDVEEVLPPVV